MEGAVACQQERVSGAGRVRQRLQGLGEGDPEPPDPEQVLYGGEGLGDRQAVQEAVDGADAQG